MKMKKYLIDFTVNNLLCSTCIWAENKKIAAKKFKEIIPEAKIELVTIRGRYPLPVKEAE